MLFYISILLKNYSFAKNVIFILIFINYKIIIRLHKFLLTFSDQHFLIFISKLLVYIILLFNLNIQIIIYKYRTEEIYV